MTSIPLFYFPVSILCVDDDVAMLSKLEKMLSSLPFGFNVQTTPNPETAIEIIKNHKSVINQNIFNDVTLMSDYGRNTTQSTIFEFNFSAILNIVNNAERYNEIGVLIADYLMPKINGIELCKKLRGNMVKKLLLTGQTNEIEAINAFNEELINCYIRKGTETTSYKISLFVEKLAKQYFLDKTRAVTIHLENNGLTLLSDNIFIQFFENLIVENKIREYYLIDKTGSFYMVNDKSEPCVLIVHNDNSLNEFLNLFSTESKISHILDKIKQKIEIPFFGIGKDPATFPLESWENHFYIAKTLEGKQNYYWNLLKGDSLEN